MGKYNFDGKNIYFEEHGQGAPLVLLHGNTSSGRMFDPVVPFFSRKYRVITIDFLGCGRSDRIMPWPDDLWHVWGDQVKAVCSCLCNDKVNIIGVSGGALAAINVALDDPELVNAVIADSFEGLEAVPSVTRDIKYGRMQAKQNDRFRKYLESIHGADWEEVFDSDTDAVIRHALKIGAFFHKPIEELKVRMMLTGSLEDEMFPKGHYSDLFKNICGRTAYAQAYIFEKGGHPAMLSNAEEFLRVADDFLCGNAIC
ncbi:MAG: alpha/beta hydrolase [Eubacteriaceae bacterium]|nr:alpha/beta hydrolase [Eubacteriaceae bacterium]